ncbi:MAG: hypothetical protein ABJ059_13835, partial [Hyphomicrobiales bacterium]
MPEILLRAPSTAPGDDESVDMLWNYQWPASSVQDMQEFQHHVYGWYRIATNLASQQHSPTVEGTAGVNDGVVVGVSGA